MPVNKTQNVTIQEDHAIREEFDVFLVTAANNSDRCLHLPDHDAEDLVPVCCMSDRYTARLLEKPVGVIPSLYYPFCCNCVEVWRDE